MPPPQWTPSGAAAASRRSGARPEPAPLMRDALRRGSMLRLPDEDPGGPQGTAGSARQERP